MFFTPSLKIMNWVGTVSEYKKHRITSVILIRDTNDIL